MSIQETKRKTGVRASAAEVRASAAEVRASAAEVRTPSDEQSGHGAVLRVDYDGDSMRPLWKEGGC